MHLTGLERSQQGIDLVPSILRKKYSLADLYAGPGGLSLGFKQSRFFQPVVAVEYKSKASETYENNLGVKVITKDVANVDADEILKVAKEQGYKGIDVVVGGPPCQAFSTANTKETQWRKIKARNQKKGNCVENPEWVNFWRIIEALQPRAFVAENVMGFRTCKDVMLDFIEKSELLGYTTGYSKLDAQSFGVPQRRKRIFIIGLRDYSQIQHSLFPKNCLKKDTELITAGKAFGDLPELKNDSPGSPIANYKKGRPTSYESLMRNGTNVL
ncbi:DNA cytosine methyltransferase, partial [Patescibacteria group bacterium]|nr:DNA cytosine methyltransferase [Patescibacteria group bacterium]